MTKRTPLLFLFFSIAVYACNPQWQNETEIYFNDFDSQELTNIDRGHFMRYNRTWVLGNFNNEGFKLTLDNIPEHNYIVVSMDLYIHDSWDGNTNELNPTGQDQDLWVMEFDPGVTRKPEEQVLFETTFSNGPCVSYRCLTQSYPSVYPSLNDPRTGAARNRLRGLCLLRDDRTGTSLYRFERWYPHDRSSVVISMYDRLLQSNADDPKCDESWSIDNLRVRVFTSE